MHTSLAPRFTGTCAVGRQSERSGRVALLAGLLAAVAFQPAADASQPLLSPPPREVRWTTAGLDLAPGGAIVATGAQEQPVARLLAAELQRLHGVAWSPSASVPDAPARCVQLVLAQSPAGQEALKTLAGRERWPVPRNVDEGYLLEVDAHRAVILAQSTRGLIYGCQTLLQLVGPDANGSGKQVRGVEIVDYPQLAFRGVHICIFPNTELAAVRQMILLAARFKYNAVVIEPWASLKSKKHPETAYENTYTPQQIRPLVQLGQALGMEMIPMLNSWGHASGMRNRSSEHVVLDRYPQFKDLYEEDGWSFRLSNPAIYEHLFDRYGELLELFAPARYFHVGMDEAWGHRGLPESGKIHGEDPVKLIVNHVQKMYDYFAQRKVRIIMWHDMFLQRQHPELGRLSPAGSVPPFNTHLALPQLPKDVILAAWNYDSADWPVPKYFHDKGFPVIVCPWKKKANTIGLLDKALKHDMLGLLATTWDSLDVCQPSVGEAGVMAWAAPGFDIKTVPFDHWLAAIRALPICNLPRLEETLQAGAPAK